MANETVRYRLEMDTANFTRNVKKAQADFAGMGKTATSTSQKFVGFSNAVGRTSDTLARSASTFGMSAKGFRAVGDAADVAGLAFAGATKAAIGFNAATFGVIGAGLALGHILGTWIRDIKAVAEWTDKAASFMVRLVSAQKDLDRQALGNMSQEEWRKRAGIEGKHAVAREQQLDLLKSVGATPQMLKDHGFGKMLKDVEKAAKGAAGGIKETAVAVKTLSERMSEAVGVGNPFAEMMGDQRTDAEKFGDYFKSLPGFDPGNGIPGGGNPFDPGAAPPVPVAGFGAQFSRQMMQLPQAILGAFQGGGSVIKSLGGFFGGAAGSSLMGKGIGKLFGGALGTVLPGVGSLVGGALGGLVGKLFGGGKSKEEKEAERQKAEQQRQRIQDAARAMRSQSIDALGGTASAFFGSRTIATADDAKRSGTLFIDAWTQVAKERGIDVAADAFSGAFQKMKADIETAGIAMPEWMKFVEGQMGLANSEGFRAAASGSRTAASFLGALGGSGGLSPESFRAFEQEARAQFSAASGAATEAGLEQAEATKAGFSATNPLLKELLNQSVVTGQTLSADIQAMVDAAGIVPDVDIQQLSELQQIRAAVQAMAGSGGGALPGPAAGGPGGGRADFGGEDRYPAFATGGSVTRTGLALVHQGEQVLSKADVQAGGVSMKNYITVNPSGNRATDEQMVKDLMKQMGGLIRRQSGGMGLLSAIHDVGHFAKQGRKGRVP